MKEIKLPRPVFDGDTPLFECEIKKLSTDDILRAGEAGQNPYLAALYLLEGGVISIGGKPAGKGLLRKFPLVSAEYVILELFKLYKIETRVEGLYICPRPGCGNKIVHEESEQEDTRDDIASLPIVFDDSGEYVSFRLELDEDSRIIVKRHDETAVEISALSFRDPLIDDLIKIASDHTLKNDVRRSKKVFFECLADVDASVADPREADFQTLKNRYLYELIALPDVRDFSRVTRGLRRYGVQPYVEIGCPVCGKVFRDSVDLTGFFLHVLGQESGGQTV